MVFLTVLTLVMKPEFSFITQEEVVIDDVGESSE